MVWSSRLAIEINDDFDHHAIESGIDGAIEIVASWRDFGDRVESGAGLTGFGGNDGGGFSSLYHEATPLLQLEGEFNRVVGRAPLSQGGGGPITL